MTRPLMIFAAGRGTRMGDLTRTRPKPMIEVAGQPLIDHAIALGRAAGATRIVANTHHLRHVIERHLAAKGVVISAETEGLLDTGGGLRAALPHLGAGPVFTLNADAIWTGPNPLAALSRAWRPGMGAVLSVVPLSRAHGRKGGGDFAMGADGRLRRGGDLVYTGAQIIDPACLDAVPDRVFSLLRVWTELAAEGRLHGVLHAGRWADVGHPDGIAEAEGLLADV